MVQIILRSGMDREVVGEIEGEIPVVVFGQDLHSLFYHLVLETDSAEGRA